MVYALFMTLVLLTFGTMWRKHPLQFPLFFITVACVLLHLVADETDPERGYGG